jgi:hypothetical protein
VKKEVLSIRIENLELLKKKANELGVTATELVVQALQDKYNLDLSSSKINKRNADVNKKIDISLKKISEYQSMFDILEFNIKSLSNLISEQSQKNEAFDHRITILEKEHD